ncbi:MAG: serine/threonine protein kinase, partial [Verrucomicrobiae bacterium]|nr:serine/threonine protein kinase [Verrucomicrobiae bacterium]
MRAYTAQREERSSPMTGKQFGPYEIMAREDGKPWLLGKGGMGETYRARDAQLGREVALKTIAPERLRDATARERFLREAKSNARLHHRNIAAVHQFGEIDGVCYYAMELIEGETLQAKLKREGALPVPQALAIARQVAQAFSEAEKHGIIHRDVKPGNIMLHPEADGELLVKLIDFGLAKAILGDDSET